MITLRKFHILVVDDNPEIHEICKTYLTKLLRAKQPIFHSSYQGEQAVEKVQELSKEGITPDLVFLDIRMPPGFDGVKTLQELIKHGMTSPVLFCSAYSDYTFQELKKKFSGSLELNFLPKPFSTKDFQKEVSALINVT